MKDDRQMDLALWRYGIISPLLHRDANDVYLCELLHIFLLCGQIRHYWSQ